MVSHKEDPDGRGRAGTRERILRAADALVAGEGDAGVSMAEVADRAGVSRQAIYLHFGSRTHLLVALVRWLAHRHGLAERLRTTAEIEDPVERAEQGARFAVRYEAEVRGVLRALDLAGADDPRAAAAWEARMAARRRHWRGVFEDLGEAGRLREGWIPARAAEAFWSLSSPASYRELVDECGWKPKAYEEWVIELLRRLFVT